MHPIGLCFHKLEFVLCIRKKQNFCSLEGAREYWCSRFLHYDEVVRSRLAMKDLVKIFRLLIELLNALFGRAVRRWSRKCVLRIGWWAGGARSSKNGSALGD